MRRLKIYEENPSATEIGKAVEVLREGGGYPLSYRYDLCVGLRCFERASRGADLPD